MNKKYIVTFDFLTVDFGQVLADSQYNENYKWTFQEILYYIHSGKIDPLLLPTVYAELKARAYNYIRRGLGYDARAGILFSDALVEKVNQKRKERLKSRRSL